MSDRPPPDGEEDALEYACARVAACADAGLALLLDAGVGADLFTHPGLRAVFTEAFAQHLSRVPVDPLTIADALAVAKIGPKDKELALAALREATPDRAAAFNPAWAGLLHQRKRKRDLLAHLKAATLTAEATPDAGIDAVIDSVGAAALALADARRSTQVSTDPYTLFLDWAQRAHVGPATGFPFLDLPPSRAGLGGLVPGQMTVGSAPSNEGKSSLAVCVIANMIQSSLHACSWLRDPERVTDSTIYLTNRADDMGMSVTAQMEMQKKVRILYFTNEMAGGHIAAKIVQFLTGYSLDEIRREGDTPDRAANIAVWFKAIKSRLLIYENSFVGSQIVSAVSTLAPRYAEDGLTTVAIIDHLHRMNGLARTGDGASGKGNLNIFYKDLSEMLHNLAVRQHVAILAFAQMGNDKVNEFRASNDVESLTFKEGGDITNVVENTFVFGKSKERELASKGWVKKVRHLENATIFDLPFYFKADPATSGLKEISEKDYQDLPEKEDDMTDKEEGDHYEKLSASLSLAMMHVRSAEDLCDTLRKGRGRHGEDVMAAHADLNTIHSQLVSIAEKVRAHLPWWPKP